MSVQELLDFIASYHKTKGEYTTDEAYQIALAYKTIPHKEKADSKNWKWLIYTVLGLDRSINGFRSYVNKRYNKELKDSHRGIFNDINYKLGIAQTQNRDYLNAIRRHNREEARIKELKQFLIEAIRKLPNLPKLNIKTIKYDNKRTAVLLLSDWHIGQENDNFTGKYNYEIAKERVEKLSFDVLNYCKIFKINKLEILLLGDFFEGVINTNARIEQEMDVCNQVIKSSELICELLNQLQYAAKEVTVRGCTDNHSRIFKDLSLNIAKENLFKIQEWMIKERMKGSKIIFPNDNLSEYLGIFTLDCNKTVAFEHGHLFCKNLSLQALLPAKKGIWIDIVCLGHNHSSYIHEYQGMRVFGNGCLCSGNTYANEKHLFSEASQKLLIVDSDNMIDIDIGFKNYEKCK